MTREQLLTLRAKVADVLVDIDAALATLPVSPSVVDPQLVADLKRDEGLLLDAYPDALSPLGKACAARGISPARYREVPGWQNLSGDPWTIGHGHTGPEVRPGTRWTQAQAEQELIADILAHNAQVDRYLPWVRNLDLARQRVIYNMAFNLGVGKPGGSKGLLGFKNTLAMIEAGQYERAADAMLKSLWAKQVKDRAVRLAEIMRTGR